MLEMTKKKIVVLAPEKKIEENKTTYEQFCNVSIYCLKVIGLNMPTRWTTSNQPLNTGN